MLSQRIIDRVKRLLKSGKNSNREIARRAEVSRATVQRIREGKYDTETQPEPKRKVEPLINSQYALSADYHRCKGCGGKVKLPCLACANAVKNERLREAG